MSEKQGKERRFPRVHSESIISVRSLSGSSSPDTVTTSKVVGLGGLMFESSKRMRIGRRLELTLLAGTDLIKIPVRVVWCRKADVGPWNIGVEFQSLDQDLQDKLLDFLMRRVYLEEEIGD